MNKQQREYILGKAYSLLSQKQHKENRTHMYAQKELYERAIKNKTCFVIYPDGKDTSTPIVGYPGMQQCPPRYPKDHPAYIKLEEQLLFEKSVDVDAILAPIRAICQQD